MPLYRFQSIYLSPQDFLKYLQRKAPTLRAIALLGKNRSCDASLINLQLHGSTAAWSVLPVGTRERRSDSWRSYALTCNRQLRGMMYIRATHSTTCSSGISIGKTYYLYGFVCVLFAY